MMRLDKYLSERLGIPRGESRKLAAKGRVTVNGVPVKKPDTPVDPEKDCVTLRGVPVVWRRYVYLLLNKPQGYVSATEDGDAPCVTELVPPEYRKMGGLSLREAGQIHDGADAPDK